MNSKIYFKLFDISTKNYFPFSYENQIWVIDPNEKKWVITTFLPTNYVWYNFIFFENIFKFIPDKIDGNENLIEEWVKYKYQITIGKNFHPDYLPNYYDWRNDFDVNKVLENGVRI